MPNAPVVHLEVWSDIACPWCYIGKRSLDEALALVDVPVEVTWRSYELDPSAPPSYGRTMPELLAKKYGGTIEQARAGMARVEAAAADRGLEYHLEDAKAGNTLAWHRAVKFAERSGLGFELMSRLFEAYLAEGIDLSTPEALAEQAERVGLSRNEVLAFLETDELTDVVRAEEAEAMELGISGVPAFVAERSYVVNGAQPPEVLAGFIMRVHAMVEADAASTTDS